MQEEFFAHVKHHTYLINFCLCLLQAFTWLSMRLGATCAGSSGIIPAMKQQLTTTFQKVLIGSSITN